MKNSLMVGVCALSLFSPTCSWGQNQQRNEDEVPQVGGRILLNSKKTQFGVNEEVVLEITLENTGKTPLRFRNWDIEFFYEFDVTAGGKKIKPVPEFKNWSRQGLFTHVSVMYPQEKRKGYFYLSRAFDFSNGGFYKVTVSQKSRQEQVEGIFTITSQPFEFMVSGPPTFGYWQGDDASAVPQTSNASVKQP